MELKDFIQGALQQIIDGIEACQEHQETLGAIVNPGSLLHREGIGLITHIDNIQRQVRNVDFEVGITSTEKSGGKTGIGVSFSGIGIGGQKSNEMGNAASTSLKFSIPVAFPVVISQNKK